MHHAIITRSKDCVAPPQLEDPRGRPWMAGLSEHVIQQATVVDIANVATYYFETAPKAVWTLDEDFRGVTPPFPLMWFEFPGVRREFSFTRKQWDELNESKGDFAILGYGILIQRRDVRPEYIKNHKDEREINMTVHASSQAWFSPNAGRNSTISVKEHQLGARWNVRMWSLIHLKDQILGPVSINDFFLDEKGDCMLDFPLAGVFKESPKDRVVTTQSFSTHPSGMSENAKLEWSRLARCYHRLLDVSFLALSFMNCRNVQLREVPPAPLKKKQLRRGDTPRVKHHVIEITPMKPRYAAVAGQTVGGVVALDKQPKSLHIIRGHFKHYGEQWGTKKLFGRVSGKFWWDKHTAGSIDAGLIESDYAVKP